MSSWTMRGSGSCLQKASPVGNSMENGLGRVGKKKSGERPGMGLGLLSLGEARESEPERPAGDVQAACSCALLLHLSNPGGRSGCWLGACILKADIGSAT